MSGPENTFQLRELLALPVLWLCLTAKLRQAACSAMPLVEAIAAKTQWPAVSRAVGLKLVAAQIMTMMMMMMMRTL